VSPEWPIDFRSSLFRIPRRELEQTETLGLLALPLLARIVSQVSGNRQSKKDDDDNHARCNDFRERRDVVERHAEIEVQSTSNFNTGRPC
jgi:hypothetical protein